MLEGSALTPQLSTPFQGHTHSYDVLWSALRFRSGGSYDALPARFEPHPRALAVHWMPGRRLRQDIDVVE